MWSDFFRYEDYVAIKPEIVLSLFAIGILITDLMLKKRDKLPERRHRARRIGPCRYGGHPRLETARRLSLPRLRGRDCQ